jgi:hypothetical protein
MNDNVRGGEKDTSRRQRKGQSGLVLVRQPTNQPTARAGSSP